MQKVNQFNEIGDDINTWNKKKLKNSVIYLLMQEVILVVNISISTESKMKFENKFLLISIKKFVHNFLFEIYFCYKCKIKFFVIIFSYYN